MSLFKTVEETRSGLKVLAYGGTGSGKTTLALSFPKICAIDSEDGMAFYKSNPNLKYILNSTSAQDVEEALEEVEDELMDKIETFVIDSETKIYENLQFSGLNVAEKRAKKNNQSVDDANLSQREWGKIKMVNKRLQATKIMLSSQGINIVSVAQEKEIKEKKGDNWVVVGHAPDTAKAFEYDYDIVLRMYTEKDTKTNEEIYKAVIIKDRTGVCKKGDIITNPSFQYWKEVYEKSALLKTDVIDYKKDIKKDESKMASELENMDDIISTFKKLMKEVGAPNQTKIQKKIKDLKIENPLKCDDYEAMSELVDYMKAL